MGGRQERNIDLFGNLRPKSLPSYMSKGPADNPRLILNGLWRVQITGKVKPRKQAYLHTFQATDARTERPERTDLLEGKGMVGARTGENIALFSSNEAQLKRGKVSLPKAGTFRLLICDLEPEATYTLSLGAKTLKQTASQVGTIFFTDLDCARIDTLEVKR